MPTTTFELHDKQCLALESPANMLLYGGAGGGGKALAIDTIIPTPEGFKTMGELSVGDYVLDEAGNPTKVVWCSDVHFEDCYQVKFNDGATVVAGASHKWATLTDEERILKNRRSEEFRAHRRATRPRRGTGKRPDLVDMNANKKHDYLKPLPQEIRTTEQIGKTLKNKRGGANHSVSLCGAWQLPERQLPIDPYVLGAWLGDGSVKCSSITNIDLEIIDRIRSRGWVVTKGKRYRWCIRGLITKLKELGVDRAKRVPQQYLFASAEQRLELLRGLMDTDGTCDKEGTPSFTNTNYNLCEAVHHLATSLGLKPTFRARKSNGSQTWVVDWRGSLPVFALPRKQARLPAKSFIKHRFIVEVEPLGRYTPLKCIQVESPSSLFLCTKSAIPTHNSHFGRVAAILAAVEVPGLPVYLVRQRYNDLKKNHFIGPTSFPVLLGDFIKAKKVEIADVEIRFANGPEPSKPFDGGSRIIGVQCLHDNDLEKIHGAELGLVIFEESTQLLQRHIEFYLGRVRVPQTLRDKIKGTPWEGRLPGAIFTTNPVGKSLSYHKQLWIDGKEPYRIYEHVQTIMDDKGQPIQVKDRYQFIPASLEDNPDIDKTEYIRSLSHLSPDLQDAILRGMWNVKFGNFYPELSAARHVVPYFTPPKHWPRFITHDWGSNAPAATIWWAVADGETGGLPRGSLYAYKEWYVVDPKDSTKGIGLSNRELARGIAERSEYQNLVCFTDSIPFQDRGHDKPMHVEYQEEGVHLVPAQMANKARSASMVRSRLVGEHDEPTLYFASTCPETFRTLAELGHHATDREKPDGSEDHLPDCVMHACRMWTSAVDSEASEARRVAAEHQKIQAALREGTKVSLRDLDPELSSILGS